MIPAYSRKRGERSFGRLTPELRPDPIGTREGNNRPCASAAIPSRPARSIVRPPERGQKRVQIPFVQYPLEDQLQCQLDFTGWRRVGKNLARCEVAAQGLACRTGEKRRRWIRQIRMVEYIESFGSEL